MSSVELLLRHTLCARHTSRCELIALRGVLAPHTGQVAKEERSAARCCASTRGGDGAAASSSIWSRRGSDETQRGRGSDETQRDRGSDETQRGRLAHELKKRGLAWLNARALCGRARARRRARCPAVGIHENEHQTAHPKGLGTDCSLESARGERRDGVRILILRGRPSHLSLTDFLRAREEFPLDHELRGPARAVPRGRGAWARDARIPDARAPAWWRARDQSTVRSTPQRGCAAAGIDLRRCRRTPCTPTPLFAVHRS